MVKTSPLTSFVRPHPSTCLIFFFYCSSSTRCKRAAAIKNQATGHYILNGKGEEVKSRSFIDLGAEWNYIIDGEVETVHTDGPLHDPVVVLVRRPVPLSDSVYVCETERERKWMKMF